MMPPGIFGVVSSSISCARSSSVLTPSAMQIRFIDPNRLTATGMSKPVGRSKSRPGPPPGDFDARSVTAAISRSGLTGSRDPRELAFLVEGGDEVVQSL